MHDIVTTHPAVVAVDALIEQADADHQAAEADLRQAWDDYRTVAAAAARQGAPLPPAPARDVGALNVEHHARRQVLRQQREVAIAENAEAMLADMLAAEKTLLAKAAPAVRKLDDIAAELGELVRSTRHLAQVGHIAVPDLYPDDVDVGVVLVACWRSLRFLQAPTVPPPTGVAAFSRELVVR